MKKCSKSTDRIFEWAETQRLKERLEQPNKKFCTRNSNQVDLVIAAMAPLSGSDDGKSHDESTFVAFVSVLVLLCSIFIHMVWKAVLICYGRLVNNKTNEVCALKPTREASTQTLEHNCTKSNIGPVYVTKTGERWHKPMCGHLVGRQPKMLTPCSDCAFGWCLRMFCFRITCYNSVVIANQETQISYK